LRRRKKRIGNLGIVAKPAVFQKDLGVVLESGDRGDRGNIRDSYGSRKSTDNGADPEKETWGFSVVRPTPPFKYPAGYAADCEPPRGRKSKFLLQLPRVSRAKKMTKNSSSRYGGKSSRVGRKEGAKPRRFQGGTDV